MIAQHFESVALFFEIGLGKGWHRREGPTLAKCWEESPNTKRQHAAQNARARFAKVRRDGECHRKHTA